MSYSELSLFSNLVICLESDHSTFKSSTSLQLD